MVLDATEVRPADFWRRHFRSGLVLSYALPASGIVRTLMSPGTPHGATIVWICVAVAALTPLMLLVPVDRLVAAGRAHLAFYAWEALGIALISVVIALDGGSGSAYRSLLFVVIAHAALAFPPAGTVGVGLASVLAYGALAAFGPATNLADTVLVAGSLAMATAVCAMASQSYLTLNRRISDIAQAATTLAEHDGLTGCFNHRTFYDKVEAAVRETPEDRSVSVLVLDVDNFKAVNDEYGHPVGDELLSALGAELRRSCRSADAPGRIGGDEFALLLVGADQKAARLTSARLSARIAAGLLPHGATVTIGAATAPGGTSAHKLVADADAALYAARRRIRGEAASRPVRSPVRP